MSVLDTERKKNNNKQRQYLLEWTDKTLLYTQMFCFLYVIFLFLWIDSIVSYLKTTQHPRSCSLSSCFVLNLFNNYDSFRDSCLLRFSLSFQVLLLMLMLCFTIIIVIPSILTHDVRFIRTFITCKSLQGI